MKRLSLLPLAAMALFAGCGGSDDGITFQVFGDPEETKVYREIVAAYEEKTGNKVELIEVADRDQHQQKLTTGFGGGDPPDSFLINYRNFGAFATDGVLDPVGPRLEASQTLKVDEFYPEPMKAFTFNGELTCMPQNVSNLVAYFNKDALKKAGVEEPSADWTYDDLVATAQKLKQANPDADALGFDPEIIRLAPFVWSAGGELVDNEQDPTAFTLDDPQSKAGVRAFFGLARFAPGEDETKAKPLEEQFIAGEIPLFMSSRRDVPQFRTITDFDWDVAPFPTLDKKTSVLHSDAYCISAGDKADASWEFVEFAAGPDGQKIAAEGGRTVPSLKSVADSPAFLNPDAEPKSSQVFLDQIPNLRALPNSANWGLVEDAGNGVTEESFFEAGLLKPAGLPELVEEYIQSLNLETESAFKGEEPAQAR